MKKQFILYATFLFFAINIQAQCTLDKSEWTLVFEDNFNTTTSSLSQNWDFDFADGPNRESYKMCEGCGYSCMEQNNVFVQSGNVHFQTEKLNNSIQCGDKTVEYATGMLRSTHDDFPQSFCSASNLPEQGGYLYGMFEVRCKLPSTDYTFPAFWLTGNNSWPPEIDAFEFHGENHEQFFSSNYWGPNNNPQNCTNYYNYPYDLTDDFHTWTVVWTPSEISWFFDGKELKTTNLNLPGSTQSPTELCRWQKMDMIINSGLCCPWSGINSFDDFIVDYVKVYKPSNLPNYTGGGSSSNFTSYYNNTLVPSYNSTTYKSTEDWKLTKVMSNQYYDYNVKSDLCIAQNGGKYIYKGDYNLLWNTYWWNGQFYSVPYSWSQYVSGDITIANNGSMVFYRYGKKAKYLQGGTFRNVSNSNIAKSSLVIDESGLNLYFIDTGNKIRHCKRSSTSSHSWTITRLSPSNVNGKIIIDPNNSNIIYFRNTSNKLYQAQKNGSSWTVTLVSPVYDATSEFTLSPDGSEIFYKNTSNRLYKLTDDNSGTWARSAVLAKFPWTTSQTYVTNISSSLSISQSPDQIYYKGYDNRVWVIYWDWDNVWKASSAYWNADYVNHGLALTQNSSGSLAFVGDDKKIRRLVWNNCEILNPTCDSNIHYKTNSTSSTTELDIDKISIYPNPVNDILYADLGDKDVKDVKQIKIIDGVGKNWSIGTYSFSEGTVEIDFSNFPSGIYYVTLYTDKQTYTHKVVKE